MMMLFFSSDSAEIKLVSRALFNAGIRCQIRSAAVHNGSFAPDPFAELWIEKDEDCHRAANLCARLGVGFDTRPIKRTTRLCTDLDDRPKPGVKRSLQH